MRPAPNSSRNTNHLNKIKTNNGGAEFDGPRKIAKKPASKSNDSHPKLSDVDDRQVERPHGKPDDHRRNNRHSFRNAGERNCGQRHSYPAHTKCKSVAVVKVKSTWRIAKTVSIT
jgi:hypothetical protein